MYKGGAKTGGVSPFEDDEKVRKPAESRNSPSPKPNPNSSERNQFKNSFKPRGNNFNNNEKSQKKFSKKPAQVKESVFGKKFDQVKDQVKKFDQAKEPAQAEKPDPAKESALPKGPVKEPALSKDFVQAESVNFPPFDTADIVHANVPHEEAEHRFKDELKPEKDLPKGMEPSIPGVIEEGKPFVAPSFPGAPTPLEERALDSKPLDEMMTAPSGVPFMAPESKDKEDDKMIEDKETDEEAKTSTDDDFGESKDPPHKEINFEEGAAVQYEQKDPLTSFPSEKLGGTVPEAGIGVLGQDSQVEVADVTESDEKAGFWEMLEDAGISRKHVYMLFGGVGAIIVIILFFVFGGYGLFTGGGEEEPTIEPDAETADELATEKDDEKAAPVATEEFSVPVGYDQAFGLSGLVNSYIFGLEFSKQKVLPGLNLNPIGGGGSMVGVEGAIAVGQGQGAAKEAMIYYIDLLRKIDNARQVDVYEYLNKYVDRRAALQDYLALLNSLLLEADSSKNTILQELTRIDAEYTATEDEKDAYEVSFFDAMSGFNGEKAHDYLQLFIEAGQKRIKQKAEYNALRALSESLDASVAVLAPRIQDLSVNAEALIKGVKVFEVPGSNIDAIILQQ
ncbi:MAG: hypothetical protein WC604_03155 [Candidatus Gracilibacteria bacterium]